jgi:uncharacterized metal-binding protein
MSGKCLCEPAEILVFPCSGASNCGQVANEIGLKLRENGKGTMYCTAGIGGHVKGLVEGAKQAKILVAIDGCPMGCAKKCLENEKLVPAVHFIVSQEITMVKAYARPAKEDVSKASTLVEKKLEIARSGH